MVGMTRYGQYCPITRSLEILGDRWTLLIVRDLIVGATRFNELSRGLPGMSRAILSKRLDHLERHGLVEKVPDGYRATPACQELQPIVFGLAEWGARWAFGEPRTDELDHLERHGLVEKVPDGYRATPACQELQPIVFGLAEWGARWAFGEPRTDELDPTVLMWWIRGGIDPAPFGGRRIVLHIHLSDGRRTRFWFVIQPGDVSLCFTDPGHDVDITLESSLSTLYQVWEGRFELLTARRDGLVSLTGRRDLLLVLPDALLFSPVAPYVRRAQART